MRVLLVCLALVALAAPSRAATVMACQDANGADWPVSPAHPCPFTMAPGTASPATFASLPSVTVTTTSTPLYTYGTPAAQLMVTNIGTGGTVYLGTSGVAGGACTAAVVGAGIPLTPGAGFLFGPAVPLPTCAMTAVSSAGSNSVALAGY